MENLENYDWENPKSIDDEEKGLEFLIKDVETTRSKYKLKFTAKYSDILSELKKISKVYDQGLTYDEIYGILGNIYDHTIEIIMKKDGEERMKNYRRVKIVEGILSELEKNGIDDKNISRIKNIARQITKI